MNAGWKRLFSDPGRAAIRVLLVIAHPDDETVGAASLLTSIPEASLLCVTDGAPRDLRDARAAGCATRSEYAALRRREFLEAIHLAGLAESRVHFVGLVDQEASLQLLDLASAVADHVRWLKPQIIVTHAYEGGHPDHDAAAFAVHAARYLLYQGDRQTFEINEMTSYFHQAGKMVTGDFLDNAVGDPVTYELSGVRRALKRAMFDCYQSQRLTLSAFGVERERFRLAPRYEFRRAPHEGKLWYEHFDWGMTGPRWRDLAAQALDQMACQPVGRMAHPSDPKAPRLRWL